MTCKSTPVLVAEDASYSFPLFPPPLSPTLLDGRRASSAPCLGSSHGYWVSQLKLWARRSHGNPPSTFFPPLSISLPLSLFPLWTKTWRPQRERDTKECTPPLGLEIIFTHCSFPPHPPSSKCQPHHISFSMKCWGFSVQCVILVAPFLNGNRLSHVCSSLTCFMPSLAACLRRFYCT